MGPLYTINQFSFVKNNILFGHVHIPSVRKNMIYCGSFDRLRHGESGKKGFFIIEPYEHKITFIENKHTMPFRDFNIIEQNINSIIPKINNFIQKYCKIYDRYIGYIRIKNLNTELKSSLLIYIRQNFPDIKISFFKSKKYDKSIEEVQNSIIQTNMDLVIPTPETLANILHEFINDKYKKNIASEVINNIIKELK